MWTSKMFTVVQNLRDCESSRIFENYSNLLEVLWKNRIIFLFVKVKALGKVLNM